MPVTLIFILIKSYKKFFYFSLVESGFNLCIEFFFNKIVISCQYMSIFIQNMHVCIHIIMYLKNNYLLYIIRDYKVINIYFNKLINNFVLRGTF